MTRAGVGLACGLLGAAACGSDDPPPHDAAHEHGEHDHGEQGHGHAGSGADAAVSGDGHEHDHEDPASQPVDPVQEPTDGSTVGDFRWNLPPGFPVPVIPENNPMSPEKVELGRRLFYDKRLSDNETQSCASCHVQSQAFTDGRATGLGSTGEAHPRGAMALVNLAYSTSLTWANPLFAMGVMDEPLERQSELPMYGDAPIELGLKSQTQIETRLQEAAEYREWFSAAFPEQDEPITAQNVARSLAAFERVLISGHSPYDRFAYEGDESALNDSAQRGYELFFGERLECFHCHAGFNFSDHVHYKGKPEIQKPYHNTGLYNIDGKGAYPAPNTGTFDVTQEPEQMGAFKAPTLRNIAVTAPYMHDGSIATLSEVLDHYSAGGRTIAKGEKNAGVGRNNPLKDPLVRGFTLTEQERADVIAFLESLTDEEFLKNPAFSDPWTKTQE
ncbi:MAG: MbnH family di-heme enzyme [Polyangiales bacterium]